MTAKKQASSKHESWQAIEVKGGTGTDEDGHAVLCSCGVQSPFFESSGLAADWWAVHSTAPAAAVKEK